MNPTPVNGLIARARATSQFNGDGIVLHALADEVERMRLWLQSTPIAAGPASINHFDLYELARKALAEGTVVSGIEFWPEHLR